MVQGYETPIRDRATSNQKSDASETDGVCCNSCLWDNHADWNGCQPIRESERPINYWGYEECQSYLVCFEDYQVPFAWNNLLEKGVRQWNQSIKAYSGNRSPAQVFATFYG